MPGSLITTLDAAGNLGLGIAPSAAWASSAYLAAQFGYGGVIMSSQVSTGTTVFNSGANFKYDGTNYRRINAEAASQYQQTGGSHNWRIAESSTADSIISFTQAMTLDASGGFLVGLTSNPNSYRAIIQGKNTTTALGGEAVLNLFDGNANSEYSNLRFATSSDGPLAVIGAKAVTGGAYPSSVGQLEFAVQNGATTTTAMVIESSGNLLVGTTSFNYAANGVGLRSNAFSYFTATSTYPVLVNLKGTSGTLISLNYEDSGVGSISTNGSSTAYNTTSDERLKENIQDADSASSLIDSLQVRQFDWKKDNAHQRYGFVAQELLTVAPEAVYQPADPEEMMAVDYSKLVPMLVKEIQSLRQRLSAANL